MKKPCGCIVKRFGDIIRFRKRGFLSSCDLDCGDAEIFGELDIDLAVTKHGGGFQVDVKILAGGFQEACFRLAAVAVGIGGVGAVVDTRQTKIFGGKEFYETVMDGGKIVLREITTSDAGLVGDEDDAITCIAKSLQTCDGAFGKFDSGGIGEIFLIDDERVVAVNENVVFIIHNSQFMMQLRLFGFFWLGCGFVIYYIIVKGDMLFEICGDWEALFGDGLEIVLQSAFHGVCQGIDMVWWNGKDFS